MSEQTWSHIRKTDAGNEENTIINFRGMAYKIRVNSNVQIPVYKQIMSQVEYGIKAGEMKSGDILPSMNDLANELNISKETVKKAYVTMRQKGLLKATQGKGYFVAGKKESGQKPKILILFDKLSSSKQVLFNSFFSMVKDYAEITLQLHNQDGNLLKFYLDENLDNYDYFVITPHFPLDKATQNAVTKQLRRVPNSKLLLLDHDMEDLKGNYGCIYQEFTTDVYEGLKQGIRKLLSVPRLNVITEMSSLYHEQIIEGVKKFCADFDIKMNLDTAVTSDIIRKDETYLILNGQLDLGLVALVKAAEEKGLKPGQDFGIISYNESPIDEIILNGLTTISTDFEQMGREAAMMIIKGEFRKRHCDFKMTRRSTF